MDKEVIIPFELAKALHEFLISKPMNKVENLVLGLRNAREYQAPKLPEPTETVKPDTPANPPSE